MLWKDYPQQVENVRNSRAYNVEIRLSNLMAFNASARGSWGCIPQYYPAVLNLVLSDKVKVRPFVKCFPLSEINTVFEMVHSRKILQRPIMVPDSLI
jgi:6-hydroxycyclohex-1-ene-1-carbonyl-CoA dehydrogenase